MKEIEDKVYALMILGIKPSVLVISGEKLMEVTKHIPVNYAADSTPHWEVLNIGECRLDVIRSNRPNTCEVYGKDRL